MKKLLLVAVTASFALPMWSYSASAQTKQECEEKIDKVESTLRKLQRTKYVPRYQRRDIREMIDQAELDNRYSQYGQCLQLMEEAQNQLVYIQGRQRQ